MGKTTKLTTEEFIKRARKVYGDKYDYSATEYINKNTKVKIICKIHGEFEKYPLDFLKGQGCQKCSLENRSKKRALTTEQFIKRAKSIHGDKYDYSKVNYINMYEKVCIICPEHGEFWMTPNAHIVNKENCPKCSSHYQYTLQEWVERFKQTHGDKYNYSLLLENGFIGDKFDAICPKHGVFTSSKTNHLKGQGCPKCGREKANLSLKSTTEEFIEKAKMIHGDKYDYSKVNYIDCRTKICIICPIHGEFWQKPNDHLNGCGCQVCKESKLEISLSKFLIENSIKFEYKKQFKWLGKQHLDFYLPEYNIAIECQGKQHFIGWGNNKEELENQLKSDIKKFEKCKIHGIKIKYYANENEIKNISYIYDNNIFSNKNDILK